MTEKPYIIFTLRRTGGTSLMSFLAAISSFPKLQHEPLNQDRIWGDISKNFAATGDEAQMAADLATRLATRPNIKHCVELCHASINRALIEATAALGYQVIVLTRKDEIGRQVSLALALSTGAWGPEQAEKIYPKIKKGDEKPAPIDKAKGLRQANHDASTLGRTLVQMRNRNIQSEWLVFEELYKGALPIETHARRIAALLGINIAAGDPSLANFTQSTGQGSREIEGFVPGLPELRTLLKAHIFP